MAHDKIVIKGAKENNLKNVDLEIPRNQLVVFTGLSGSGKSSLAFDTIYAEGQRRYVESLSSYARQFLGQMEKPDVESIEGLSPAISIDQKTTNHNPRSTVGTVTEIYDYLRLLYARVGTPHCPQCGKEIKRQTVDQIVDQIMLLPATTKIQLLAPVVRNRKGQHVKLLENAQKSGYVRCRINGVVYELEEEIKLDKNKKHTIEIIIDRLIVKDGIEKRLSESIESVSLLTNGVLTVLLDNEKEIYFSQNYSCADCSINLDEVEPRLFSFNNPSGACPDCTGLGIQMKFDRDLVIPDETLSLLNGAVAVKGWSSGDSGNNIAGGLYKGLATKYKFDLNTPFKDLSVKIQDIILYGVSEEKIKVEYTSNGETRTYNWNFEGVINTTQRRYRETASDSMRQEYEAFMTNVQCKACKGQRLNPDVLAITINDKNISDITTMTAKSVKEFFESVVFTDTQKLIADQILKEIYARTGFMIDVGLDYLTLSRSSGTLSGGESQRIRLATQIGSGLVGVVYILDEPSIGLHQRDNDRLLKTLKHLKDIGNTLIVVEHDIDTLLQSDFLVDIGPLAGDKGGEVVFAGKVEDIVNCERSITGDYISGRRKIEVPTKRRKISKNKLIIKGASENNLKNINVSFPIGVFTCVTGVSGSGKSSLVNKILYAKLARELNKSKTRPGLHSEIIGIEMLDKVINIDQTPIGRTPRSNSATYTGVFDLIRDLFANTNEAKIRGYLKGRFSFNVKGGRCEACRGDGIIKIEMHFLPDVYVPCEVCDGKRYSRETLEVKYKGKNISEVLGMTIEEAGIFFENIPKMKSKLDSLNDVGLSYIKLGQPSTTLSGGEAQRVKLATELSKRSTGKTLYILDEPTTGLHTADVHKLVGILQKLTDGGNTVVVIEHNLDVIKTADYIIDIGPEGGDRGGKVVVTGTPEQVIKCDDSYTAFYLRKLL
jgi:excinuclease ABC subunit A